MKNEPVAWMHQNPDYAISKHQSLEYNIPLYTQDQLEEARKLGMQQEQALWNLSASTQEIMDTHPVKEFFEDEPQAEELHEIMQSNTHPVKEQLTDEEFDNIFAHGKRLGVLETEDRFRKAMKLKDEEIIGCWDGVDPPDECWITDEHLVLFARAILRKAQEK